MTQVISRSIREYSDKAEGSTRFGATMRFNEGALKRLIANEHGQDAEYYVSNCSNNVFDAIPFSVKDRNSVGKQDDLVLNASASPGR